MDKQRALTYHRSKRELRWLQILGMLSIGNRPDGDNFVDTLEASQYSSRRLTSCNSQQHWRMREGRRCMQVRRWEEGREGLALCTVTTRP